MAGVEERLFHTILALKAFQADGGEASASQLSLCTLLTRSARYRLPVFPSSLLSILLFYRAVRIYSFIKVNSVPPSLQKQVSIGHFLSSVQLENGLCMAFCLNSSAKLFTSWLFSRLQPIHAFPVLPSLSFPSLATVVMQRLPASGFGVSVFLLTVASVCLCCCALHYSAEKCTQ